MIYITLITLFSESKDELIKVLKALDHATATTGNKSKNKKRKVTQKEVNVEGVQEENTKKTPKKSSNEEKLQQKEEKMKKKEEAINRKLQQQQKKEEKEKERKMILERNTTLIKDMSDFNKIECDIIDEFSDDEDVEDDNLIKSAMEILTVTTANQNSNHPKKGQKCPRQRFQQTTNQAVSVYNKTMECLNCQMKEKELEEARREIEELKRKLTQEKPIGYLFEFEYDYMIYVCTSCLSIVCVCIVWNDSLGYRASNKCLLYSIAEQSTARPRAGKVEKNLASIYQVSIY